MYITAKSMLAHKSENVLLFNIRIEIYSYCCYCGFRWNIVSIKTLMQLSHQNTEQLISPIRVLCDNWNLFNHQKHLNTDYIVSMKNKY